MIEPNPNQTGDSFSESTIGKLIKELGGSEEEVKALLNKMAKRSSWKGVREAWISGGRISTG
ncbi:MAG: hypothetical protein NUV70_08555 [Caldiserica bacterium]|nr:hypothetical protein [Caldisericota bacterium]